MRTVTAPGVLRARAVAYALLGRILGPDVGPLADPETIEAARAALVAAGEESALARFDGLYDVDLPPVDTLAGRWVRWFDLGRVAPYEGSNVARTAGGVTPRLADVAGFYRAFDMGVSGDRPDHVVAQLEFLAVTVLAEAEAIENGDVEAADVTAHVTRNFVRDHIGGWIDVWAARVGAIDDLAPWFPIAASAAELVRREAVHRNVVPLQDSPVLPADAGIPVDEEGLLTCEDDPAHVDVGGPAG